MLREICVVGSVQYVSNRVLSFQVLLSSSRIDQSNKGEKQSPVKKHLNFISDVKLSTTKESLKASENDPLLSNRFGLSFGDVNFKEHLYSSNANFNVENSCNNSENIVYKQDRKNKENCPIIIVDNMRTDDKLEVELVSSDQSSQTETISLQNTKAAPKPAVTLLKKPPQPVKPASNVLVKTSLAPLVVNKTVPSSSMRKTVPLSPTNTAPPRCVVPGRNVAAAAFVPSKKVTAVTPQTKAHSKSTPNLNKSSNMLNEPARKESEDAKNSSTLLDTSVLEVHKSSETKESNPQKREDTITNSQKSDEIIKKNEKNDSTKEELKPAKTTNGENKYTGEEKKEKMTKPIVDSRTSVNSERQSSTKLATDIIKTTLISSGEKKDDKKEETVVTVNAVSTIPEKVIIYKKKETVKKEKCDKCVMTDLPYIPPPKQPTAKVAVLVRNKTVPSLVRKSNETLCASDSIVRNNAISASKTLPSSIKKQPNVIDVTTAGDKPAYAAVSKVFRSNTAIELRPKIAFNTRVHVASKYAMQDKQVIM